MGVVRVGSGLKARAWVGPQSGLGLRKILGSNQASTRAWVGSGLGLGPGLRDFQKKP
jgi:hypothetical protein